MEVKEKLKVCRQFLWKALKWLTAALIWLAAALYGFYKWLIKPTSKSNMPIRKEKESKKVKVA